MPRAANDNRREKTEIGDGNIEWLGRECEKLLKRARIDKDIPLLNIAELMGAAVSRKTPVISRDGAGVFLYVVGDIEASSVKIGIARNPTRRLAELQTGNPNRLYLHRVFSFKRSDTARRVEEWSHSIAEEKYTRLEGEWFDCSPSQAHEVIDSAADEILVGYLVVTPTYLDRKTFAKAA